MANGSQAIIRYLSEVEGFVPWTWWPHEEVGHTDEARKEIQGLFDTQTAFDTPKPTRLVERVLQIATNPGDLDSGFLRRVGHDWPRRIEAQPSCARQGATPLHPR